MGILPPPGIHVSYGLRGKGSPGTPYPNTLECDVVVRDPDRVL